MPLTDTKVYLFDMNAKRDISINRVDFRFYNILNLGGFRRPSIGTLVSDTLWKGYSKIITKKRRKRLYKYWVRNITGFH